jgi:hypothetical protein
MKKLTPDQRGFIPMLICILLVIGAIIYVAFTRVLNSPH